MSRVFAVVAVIVVLVSVMVTAGSVAGKPAGGGSNSPNAKKCYKGGYTLLYRTDGSRFATEQACTSYAANGGILVTATPTPPPTNTPVPTATPEPLSDGCAFWNDPVFDQVVSAGTITPAFGYKAGETVSWTAGLPADPEGATFRVTIFLNPGVVIRESTVPGTLTYTFTTDVLVDYIEWGVIGGGTATWTMSCERTA